MPTNTVHVLCINDETKDVRYVAAGGDVDIVELSDFAYRNSTARDIHGAVRDDLAEMAELPEELRDAAYTAIAGWLDEHVALLRAHYPNLVADWDAAARAGAEEWAADADADDVAAWERIRNS